MSAAGCGRRTQDAGRRIRVFGASDAFVGPEQRGTAFLPCTVATFWPVCSAACYRADRPQTRPEDAKVEGLTFRYRVLPMQTDTREALGSVGKIEERANTNTNHMWERCPPVSPPKWSGNGRVSLQK